MFLRFLGLFIALAAFGGAGAREVRIPIAATSDLHGNTARIALAVRPALEKIHERYGVMPVYCDLGDVAEGSLAMLHKHGAGAVGALNSAGCAIFVPGNHDVSFGLEAFHRSLAEFQGAVLAANLHCPEAEGLCQPFVVVERAGFRIAFIGLMLKDLNASLPVPETRFQTFPGLEKLPAVMDEVRKLHPDAVVLLRHAGVYGAGEELFNLLTAAPGIDLVIGGHTHRADPGSMVRSSWYVQPGARAESLALATLVFDEKSRKLKQIESRLVELPGPAESDPELARPAPPLTGKADNFVAECMLGAVGTDAAIYAIGNADAWRKLRANPAPTVGDYFAVFPYFDPVVRVTVSGAELKAILMEYIPFAASRKMHLVLSGGTFSVKKGRLDLLEMEKTKSQYTLALTAYAAAGAGGKLPVTRAILAGRVDPKMLEKATPLLELLLP